MEKSRGENAAKLARNIACVKYTLFCFNIVAWVSLGSKLDFNWRAIACAIHLATCIGALSSPRAILFNEKLAW